MKISPLGEKVTKKNFGKNGYNVGGDVLDAPQIPHKITVNVRGPSGTPVPTTMPKIMAIS